MKELNLWLSQGKQSVLNEHQASSKAVPIRGFFWQQEIKNTHSKYPAGDLVGGFHTSKKSQH